MAEGSACIETLDVRMMPAAAGSAEVDLLPVDSTGSPQAPLSVLSVLVFLFAFRSKGSALRAKQTSQFGWWE